MHIYNVQSISTAHEHKHTQQTTRIAVRANHDLFAPIGTAVARWDARSLTLMQAPKHVQSGCPAHTEPGHGSRTAVSHSMHIFEVQSRSTSPTVRHQRQEPRSRPPKRCAWLQLPPRVPRAFKAHGSGPSGPSRAARAPPVDSIAARISTASRTPTGSSQWFSGFERDIRVDLAHSAPSRSISLPIVMMASTPARRDHLALIGSACTPPAGHCTAAAQRGEQKRSVVQWRSALSTAL